MPTVSENVRLLGVVSTGRRTLYLEREMECGLMGHQFHRGFTAAEKTELWDRWKRGESLKAIGRAFGKQSSSIYFRSAWWDSSCGASSLQAGIVACGTRRYGTSIGTIHREVAGRSPAKRKTYARTELFR